MSCQQAPRLTEDPYTFTDTAPTTATLFNPQIHKLAPISISQQPNDTKISPQKAQILTQNQRIFSNQQVQPQFVKQQQQQQTVLTNRINGTNTTNFINGIHQKNVICTTTTATTSISPNTTLCVKQKPLQQKFYHFNNNNIQSSSNTTKLINNLNINQSTSVSQIISTTPTRKFISIPFPPTKQQQQHQQQLPQIVSLHQSHPLYSVAKQTQILTGCPLTTTTTTTTISVPTVTTSTIQKLTNQSTTTLLPPLYQRNNSNNNNNNNNNSLINNYQQFSSVAPTTTTNSINVQQIRNHSNFINNSNKNQISTTPVLSYPTLTVVNSTGTQQQQQQNASILIGQTTAVSTSPTLNNITTNNQPLPVSNFAQPQQIKQLSSSSSSSSVPPLQQTPQVINTGTVAGYKNINRKLSNTISVIKLPAKDKETKLKKRKISSENLAITATNTGPNIIADGGVPIENRNNNDNTIFVAPTPTAKIRDTRVFSTGSVAGKLKSTNNKSQLSSAARTRRAYSQTSHHEALQRISPSAVASIIKTEWHAPESYAFDLLGPFTKADNIGNQNNNIQENNNSNSNCNNYYFYENSSKCDNDLKSISVQTHWLQVEDIRNSIPSWSQGREKRIELRKAQLRRQAMQYIFARKFMSPLSARKRLVFVSRALKKLKNINENSSPPKKCCIPSCQNSALSLTTYCNLHITKNTNQHLFLPCTAKFADNTQCRIPVFDISHELPLCREHAWKRDNYQRIVQEQKPKKTSVIMATAAAKKRLKSNNNYIGITATTTPTNRLPPKRSKKKRKPLMASDSGLGGMENYNGDDSGSSIIGVSTLHGNNNSIINRITPVQSPQFIHQQNNNQIINNSIAYQIGNSGNYEISPNDYNNLVSHVTQITLPTSNIITSGAGIHPQIINRIGIPNYISAGVTELTTQEMLNICENSSTYESSEDTGVGGLSESELISGANDVIEEIPLGDTRLLEEHDLTNVLNQLPVDAFNELFTTVEQNGPLEPTQEEQEYLERALELVNKQVKSLEQMTSGDQLETNFLESFLDVDECQMLDDSDICTEDVLHSPDTSGIDTSTLLVDNCSNSVGSCSNSATPNTPTDIRNLVHTK